MRRQYDKQRLGFWSCGFGGGSHPAQGLWYYLMPAKGTYPRQWTKQLRQRVRARQNYCCALCGEKTKKLLNIHHISEDKNDCSLSNLVGLCVQCHGIVHGTATFEQYQRQLSQYTQNRDRASLADLIR